MLERITEAQAVADGERDNLLEAIAALCVAGQMTVMPRSDNLIHKPVILLPQKMYDRLLEKHGKEKDDE
jgi:hypothetical protein